MTTFTHTSPGAVRCADCQYSPGRHNATCQTTRHPIHKLGAWRKCKAFEPKGKPCLADVSRGHYADERPPRWRHIDARDGDLWIGTEPVWTYAWDKASEDEVLEELRQWLRWRRAETQRWFDVAKRRAAIKPVD